MATRLPTPGLGAFLVLVLGVACSQHSARASGPPKTLDRATATKLLELQGYQNVAVGALINGIASRPFRVEPGAIGDMGSPSGENVATVLGVATMNGKPWGIREAVFYDPEMGWFLHEWVADVATRTVKLRLWTAQGFRELKQASLEPTR